MGPCLDYKTKHNKISMILNHTPSDYIEIDLSVT